MAHFFWTVLLPAAVLDLLLGDPHWMPHPVRWICLLYTSDAADE